MVARVIAEEQSPFALVLTDRADEEASGERDVRGPECRAQAVAPDAIMTVAPLDRDGVTLTDGCDGKYPLPWIGLSLTVAFGDISEGGVMPGGTPFTLLP